jgi:NACHT domain
LRSYEYRWLKGVRLVMVYDAALRIMIDAKDALNKLVYINARGHQHESCAEGTRIDMLDGIARWASDSNAEPMLALVDQAGTGKSTIAAHMTKEWENEGSSLARFFFSKPSTVTGNGVATTLARDIAESVPSLGSLVVEAVEKHPNYAACSLQQQLEWLVFAPLKSLKGRHILVIDALDECSKGDRAILLKSTLDFISGFEAGSCPLKVLLTSRPEEDIVSRIREPRYAKSIHNTNFSLHSKENTSNEDDVRNYITRVLSNHLTPEQVELLTRRANGLFIWASTAQAFISSALDPVARFEKLMESDSSLNSLYDDVLSVALKSAGDEEDIVMKVLRVICVAQEPLTVEMMDELLGLRSGIAQRVVIKLSSVLSDGSDGAAIYVLHPTFLEYLQGVPRDLPIVTMPEAEGLMATGCLKVLSSGLKYNICGLVRPRTYRRKTDKLPKSFPDPDRRRRTSRRMGFATLR